MSIEALMSTPAVSPAEIRVVDDPRLKPYVMKDSGITALVTGPTGSGKTLAFRHFIEQFGAENAIVVATDPRLFPLDGLDCRILEAWMEPGAEGLELKQAAARAYQKIQDFFIDLGNIQTREDVKFPLAILFDSLSNYGDIMQVKTAPIGGQLSMQQWGDVGRNTLQFVSWVRGFQRRRLLRIFNCTSGWTKDDMNRTTQELLIGMGGKMTAKYVFKHFDLMFHVESNYAPGNEAAGPDGMLRQFHTCEHDGIVAKGHPNLPTPTCPADWGYVYRQIFGGGEGGH